MTLSNNQQPRFSRSGFTLVEMLVAMTLSLVLFLAIAEMFAQLGSIMDDGRALIEMSGELRGVTHTLQQDLDNRTVEVQPWIQPGTNQGYFEIIEGPDRDGDFAKAKTLDPHNLDGIVNMGGDADDVLAFTAYSKDEPFVGLIQGELKTFTTPNNKYKYWVDRSNKDKFTAITSQYAEIIYWTRCTPNDDRQVLLDKNEDVAFKNGKRNWDETVTLYRRVLLIRPDIAFGNNSLNDIKTNEMRNYYDLSVQRFNDTTVTPQIHAWVTNSLEELQNRKNRFAHLGSNRIFPMNVANIHSFERLNENIIADTDIENERDRTGEDVVLSKVLAFDVRVFDPTVSLKQNTAATIAVQPGDLGYANLLAPPQAMSGAYVDLNWARQNFADSDDFKYLGFRGRPHRSSQLNGIDLVDFAGIPSVSNETDALNVYSSYDTWPFLYEMDGIDTDREKTGKIDQGTNGFDDPRVITTSNNDVSTGIANIIDDAGELETSPPYPEPLRGIQVQIRVYEDGTRQIRQDTVMGDFIPE